ncbi:MAG: DUF1684 domain-containing protein [Brevibacterium sp.]|nr:DUF1684 domain-containing protein [Brevibacterium sp.]MDN5833282.1 DUF1684 domain-containing protein [Brevibacterium sp.]MDN5876307.1 DUF1684 domain-containing protein [Brevibacterium sp.]MDN5909714.1 DUF1684 domain-containing protein [Brevibacterium sp.]MDN6133154.1 DUF1684 domain-containing protein [Brevibacterium sp.]
MNQFVTEWNTWRDSRNSALATPFGWLSVTGLHWLDETTAWPDAPGTFTVDDGWVSVALDAGTKAGPAAATFDLMSKSAEAGANSSNASPSSSASVPSDTTVLPKVSEISGPEVRVEENGFSAKLPTGGSLQWFTVGHVLYELIDRAGRIGIRVRDSKSPLLGKFFEVPVFDPNPDFVFLAKFTPFEKPEVHTIKTAQDDLNVETPAVGIVSFASEAGEVKLLATGNPASGLQLDFHDSTNGETTPAWRTLDLGIPNQDGSLVVDFNRAVDYPFAFTAFATCPAPIDGNVVPFEVTAGERTPPFYFSEAGINVPFLFYVWWDEESAEVTRPWYARFGLDITLLNPNHDDVARSLVGFDGVAMSGADATPLTRKARSRLVKVATEALTSRIPVIGIGAFAEFVIRAQRELRESQGYADGIEQEYAGTDGKLLIVMNNELAPQKAGFDVVHTDASGLLYVEMPYDIPLESDFNEIDEFEAAMDADAPINSWQEFDYRIVCLVRQHR